MGVGELVLSWVFWMGWLIVVGGGLQDVNLLSEQDKVVLQSELVPGMIIFSNPADKTICAQVAESLSLIAVLDFPKKWDALINVSHPTSILNCLHKYNWYLEIQQLISYLSQTEYTVNIGVLKTAHSIFCPWHAHTHSNSLFTDINFVISHFMTPTDH